MNAHTRLRPLVSLAVAFALTCFALTASAGIIVTEGKVAKLPGTVLKANRRLPVSQPSPAATNPGAPAPTYASDAPEGSADDAPPEGQVTEPTGLDSPVPAGWTCTMLSGGLELCEPLAAPGGAKLTTAAATETEGCQGGSSAPGALVTALMTLLGLAAVRRRA